MICEYCKEEILPHERADNKPGDFHVECLFRGVAGSVGHINKRCSCFGGTEGDPPNVTLREAARAALTRYRELKEHTVTLDESQRQAVLMAIAHLAVARPGWDFMLSEIALKMDNKTADGRPEMFEDFKRYETSRRQS